MCQRASSGSAEGEESMITSEFVQENLPAKSLVSQTLSTKDIRTGYYAPFPQVNPPKECTDMKRFTRLHVLVIFSGIKDCHTITCNNDTFHL